LYDAVATTARRLAKRAPAHGAVVVLTDGIDTSSVLSPEEVSGVASSIDVPVFIVMTVPPVDVPGFSGRDGDKRTADVAGLEDLAAWTGGDLVWATGPLELGAKAHAVVSELRHQYVMAIEAAADPEWRPLDVRVRNSRLRVRARSGYFSKVARP
jgi:hypothetical protein